MLTALCLLLAAGGYACVGDSPVTPPADASASDTSSGDALPDDAGGGCDAGATSCSGVCVSLASDALNCGRCDHDCGPGASCTSGVCQPVLVTSKAAGAVTLATEATPDNPSTLATHVFWGVPSGSGAGAFQDNVGGGNQITLSAGAPASDIAVHGTNVYWAYLSLITGGLTIYRGNVDGAGSQTPAGAAASAGPSYGIVLDPSGSSLFGTYTKGANYVVYKCALTNTPCTTVTSFSGTPALNVATDGTSVFVAGQDSGTISAVGIASSNVSVIVNGQATPNLLRVDGTHLYWSNAGTMTLWRSTLSGGQPKQIASTTAPADGLAADAVNVYWTDSAAGTVSYAPIGGSGPTTVYVTQGTSASPMRLVRDSKSLYWISGSSIYRVALP